MIRSSQKLVTPYHVYILRCKDGSLYTGITTDVRRRFAEHAKGRGGSYAASRGVDKVLWTEKFKTRGEALKREAQIKKLKKEKKIELIRKNP